MTDAGETHPPGQASHPVPAEDLRVALDAERAAAEHWRQIAQRRGSSLDAIRRRTTVRALLALERRAQPLRDGLPTVTGRLRHRLARGRLLFQSLAARRGLPSRRARLTRILARLPARPQHRRRVSIVTVADRSSNADPRTPQKSSPVVRGPSVEVIVVRAEPTADTHEGADRVLDASGLGSAAAASVGARAASGDLLCFLAPMTQPLEAGWLDRLAVEIRGSVVAATPTLIHPERRLPTSTPHDLRIRMAGIQLEVSNAGVPNARSHEAGLDVDPRRSPIEVAAGSAACLVVDRRAYEDVGGLAPLDDLDTAMFDLCQRLRETGKSIVAVPSSVAFDHRTTSSVRELTSPINSEGPAWRTVVDRHGPALVRSARGADREPLSFALTVAAPSAKVAHRWGDWHLALALARSLRRLGHRVLVQTADHSEDLAGRSCDVHVVLRGLAPVRRTSGQRHVLWVISHPEQIDTDECDEADLVVVASHRFAHELRGRTSTPVEVLLQATDHRRFRPVAPDPMRTHPIVVVAKTRDVLRPAVADALAAGLRPAIYGSGWEDFVDADLIVADYVSNEELPIVYSSAGVLLNDHWDTMRSWGFVSNRLFDALACGTPVISDHVPEVLALFADAVPTYRSPEELAALVRADLEDPTAARRRASDARLVVLGAHTFDHRARELRDALARHQIDHPPS